MTTFSMKDSEARNSGEAEPSIQRLLNDFLAEQAEALTPRALARYELVIRLLRECLNDYAYQDLDLEEAELFEKSGEEEDSREDFCAYFGADKIVTGSILFLEWFIIRKLPGDEVLTHSAGRVIERLSEWLGRLGHIPAEESREGMRMGEEAAGNYPMAERASHLLLEHIAKAAENDPDPGMSEVIGFDSFTIGTVEEEALHLRRHLDGRRVGPVPLPREIMALLREGWEVAGKLGRFEDGWRFLEIAGIYPV